MSDDDKKISVDTGLKVALKSIGVNEVPEEVSQEEFEKLSSKVSQGVRLRMEQKAKEQNRVIMWKSRVNLVKQARQLMQNKSFSEAAVSYEKYLKVLELVYELKSNGLTPELFNKSTRSKELTIITSVYWDLVRIYDTSPTYHDRMQRSCDKLIEFLPYSSIFPQIVKRAIGFQRSCKNPRIIKTLIKSVKGKKGCFIATTVYGDPNHPQVVQLRNFRDNVLIPSFYGRQFVNFYYFISPTIARNLVYLPKFRKTLRIFLNYLIGKLNN